MKSNYEFRANAVGVVEEGIAEGEKRKGRYGIVSRVRVFEKFAEGLSGIREYSHLIVIWHMHKTDEVKLKVKPSRESTYMSEVGIFATRFPPRPNHIAASVVELVSISGSSLSVRGLDAWPGSPVLDIKPYDYYDIVKNAQVPPWFKLFWEERSSERHYGQAVPWLGP